MEVRILSVDGGGIRGIIPAVILAEIERRLRARGACGELHEAFHLMAGASTGALIALALSVPAGAAPPGGAVCDAAELVGLYRRLGPAIFPAWRRRYPARLHGALRCRYRDEALTAIVRRMFGEQTLDQALTDLLIPCYDTEARAPRFFERRPALDPEGWGSAARFRAWEVARAATAAPTYFAPARVRRVGGLSGPGGAFSLIDGGVFANNPSLCASAAARRLYPDAESLLVVSVGTGVTDRPYPYEQARSWGSLDWISPRKGSPLIDVMLDGQSDEAVRILDTLQGVRHLRLNPRLDPRCAAMDNADARNVACLEEAARRFVADHDALLEELCSRLTPTPQTHSREAA